MEVGYFIWSCRAGLHPQASTAATMNLSAWACLLHSKTQRAMGRTGGTALCKGWGAQQTWGSVITYQPSLPTGPQHSAPECSGFLGVAVDVRGQRVRASVLTCQYIHNPETENKHLYLHSSEGVTAELGKKNDKVNAFCYSLWWRTGNPSDTLILTVTWLSLVDLWEHVGIHFTLLFIFIYLFVHHLHMDPWSPEEGIRSPGAGITDSCEPPCRYCV